MSDKTQETEQKIPLLNSIFGENSDGENGLKVFADTWKRDDRRNRLDYVKTSSALLITGGALGMILNGVIAKISTDEPIDDTLSQENISIIHANSSGYAAIQTEDGAQLYKLSRDMKTMTLIKDPNKAQEEVTEIIEHFEDAKAASFCCGFPESVEASNITVLLNNGNETAVRNLSSAEIQSVYNPAAYSQEQITFWGDISSEIENGRYDVPNIEVLPLDKGEASAQATKSPYSFLVGAFALNALLYSGLVGGGGAIPVARKTVPQLSRPGFGNRKDDNQEPEPPS